MTAAVLMWRQQERLGELAWRGPDRSVMLMAARGQTVAIAAVFGAPYPLTSAAIVAAGGDTTARASAAAAGTAAAAAQGTANGAMAAAGVAQADADAAQATADGAASSAATARTFLPGALASGVWKPCTGLPRLLLNGTGTVTIDARNRAGSVTSAAYTTTLASAVNQIDFPFFGDDAVEVRAAYTGSASAEIV